MSDTYYKDKEYYQEKTSLFFGYIFKFAFVVLLVILVYRSVLNLDTFTFSNLLNLLQNCPDYLGDLLPDISSYINYEYNANGFFGMIGLGGVIEFLHKVIGGLAYIFACFIHLIKIIIYFTIGLLF